MWNSGTAWKDGATQKNCWIWGQSQVEHKGGQARTKLWEECQVTVLQGRVVLDAKQGSQGRRPGHTGKCLKSKPQKQMTMGKKSKGLHKHTQDTLGLNT